MNRRWMFVVALAAVGCGSSRYARDGGAVSVMSVRAVDWNPQKIDVGDVSAVVESEGNVVVFGDKGASVFSSGALVAVDHSASTWRMATSIPAADGNGRWIVAIDGAGTIYRLRNGTTLEPIGARYGMANDKLVAVADFGDGYVAFMGEAGFTAVANGKTITRYDAFFVALAGGGGKGAGLESEAVRLFEPKAKMDRVFDVPWPRFVAVDAHGRLYVATEHEVYEENPRGELSLRYETGGTIHGLTPSGERVWFADDADLGSIEPPSDRDAGGVWITRDSKLGANARLAPSPSGDVWTIAGGVLSRFARTDATSIAPNVDAVRAQTWTVNVQPIFARRCASCHLPGGSSGVDLSTFDAWSAKKALVRKRVVDTRTMPPKGNPIDDAERATIEEWTR